MTTELFPILMKRTERECLRSHAQRGSPALKALESATEIDPKFLAAVAYSGAEVAISYEEISAAELKALARVHCPSAIQAIEKDIRYNQGSFTAAELS